MAKNLKVILTEPAGKRVDQRLSGPQEEGGLPVDPYELLLADGSLVEMVLPCRQHELMVNWSSSEATPAEKIRRRLVRQSMNARDFEQNLLAMDATAGANPAQLFIIRYAQPGSDPETRGPFPVEPGKPWKLTFEHSKRTAAVIVIGSSGVCVKSDIFGPAGIHLEGYLHSEVGNGIPSCIAACNLIDFGRGKPPALEKAEPSQSVPGEALPRRRSPLKAQGRKTVAWDSRVSCKTRRVIPPETVARAERPSFKFRAPFTSAWSLLPHHRQRNESRALRLAFEMKWQEEHSWLV